MDLKTYGDFTEVIHARTATSRQPMSVTIEISDRCPLDCAHCYNNLPMDDVSARKREMTTADHFELIDALVEQGCLWVCYSGGEIFARRDFLEIYTHAKRQGLIVTLFTNGTMITESIADYLADWRPFVVEITLYGATRPTYEALTRVPGSYDKCMRGIDLLLERNIPLKLKTVGTSINRHEIRAMRDFAAGLGVDFAFDSMINPRIDCSRSPLAVRLTPEEIVALDLEEPERVLEWKNLTDETIAQAALYPPQTELYTCGGGMSSLAVDPYGELSICVISHADTFNIRGGKFREGWDHFIRGVRSRKVTRPTKCLTCALKSMCGMCPAQGELENLDPEAPVDFLCHTAHLRAAVLGTAVPAHGDCEYCAGAGQARVAAAARTLTGGDPARVEELLRLGAEAAATKTKTGGCSTGGCGSCALPPTHDTIEERTSA